MSRSGPGRARHVDVRGILDTDTVILLDRLTDAQLAESSFRALPFDAAAARRFGWVAANLRQAGRKPAAQAYDALIAAVALANELPRYTVDPADFQDIDGLTVRSIPHPGAATAV